MAEYADDRAVSIAAARIGIRPSQYAKKLEQGFRWCSGHKRWHRADAFAVSGGTGYCRAYWRLYVKRRRGPTKLETAVQALRDIVDPIGKMRRETPEGHRLDGAGAAALSASASHLQEIARQALEQIEGK